MSGVAGRDRGRASVSGGALVLWFLRLHGRRRPSRRSEEPWTTSTGPGCRTTTGRSTSRWPSEFAVTGGRLRVGRGNGNEAGLLRRRHRAAGGEAECRAGRLRRQRAEAGAAEVAVVARCIGCFGHCRLDVWGVSEDSSHHRDAAHPAQGRAATKSLQIPLLSQAKPATISPRRRH